LTFRTIYQEQNLGTVRVTGGLII